MDRRILSYCIALGVFFSFSLDSEEVHRTREKLGGPRPIAELPEEDRTEENIADLDRGNRLGGNKYPEVGEQPPSPDLGSDRFRSSDE